MARIPSVPIGQKQITTQAPVVRAEQGVFSTAVPRATQELAQITSRISQQFEEAQILAEKTRAGTETMRKFKELELEAQSARNIDDITKFRNDYKNRTSKIREEASKLITLPQAKSEFTRAFDRDAIFNEFNIRKTLQQNQNIALESILNENLAQLRESYISGSPESRASVEVKRDLLLDDAVNRGVVTIAEAQIAKGKQQKEWRLAKIDADIEGDAEFALEQLLLGEQGIYADVDAGDRLAKETKANTKLKRNEKVAKKITNERHTKNELDLTQKLFTNELTFAEIQEQFISNNISQKYAGVLDAVLTSPDAINAKTDNATYGKMITAYLGLDESDLDNLREFKIKVLGFHGAGMLSRNDTEFLINKTIDPFTQQKDEGKGFLASTIETIKKWAENSPEPIAATARMINKFVNRVDEKTPEEDIVKAGQDIVVEQQKVINPNRARYQINQVIKLKSGEWKVVDFKEDGDPILEKF